MSQMLSSRRVYSTTSVDECSFLSQQPTSYETKNIT